MTFVLDDQQQMLQETFERFFREKGSIERLRQLREHRDQPGCDPELWREMAELGFCGLMIDEAHGGLGMGLREMALLLQHAGQWLMPEPLLSSALLAPSLLRLAGDSAQQDRWLPELAAGTTIGAVAWSEPTTRLDPLDQRTTATAAGNDWVLNGEKQFVLDGNVASLLIVSA
ncbi:MAG: acyl-CoA dehydrogenase, partial [Candidatus Dadabacteria bacterium]